MLKIICVALAIIIIPLEIFLENVLQNAEDVLIIKIQNNFSTSTAMEVFFKIPIYFVRINITCLFMCVFFLLTDSLLAFKAAFLTCFGIYLMIFFKLIYKDNRPFWDSPYIEGRICEFDFGGPALHLFIVCFFWVYNIIMYFMKYAKKINKPLVISLLVILFIISVWIIIAGQYTGTTYIYQNLIGCVYGFIYLVTCLSFDNEIHKLCEKIGFILYSSRKYKFYLLFVCVAMFILIYIYYNSENNYWSMPS